MEAVTTIAQNGKNYSEIQRLIQRGKELKETKATETGCRITRERIDVRNALIFHGVDVNLLRL